MPPLPPAAVTIPIEAEQNQILIPVTVGKSGTLTFLLDTGAEGSVIATDRLEDAGLSGGVASSGSTQGGEIETRVFKRVSVSAGNLTLGRINVAAVDLSGLRAGTGRHIDGILGYEFFRDRVVRIDYAAGKLFVLSRGAPLGAGLPLKLTIRGNTPFIDAHLRQGRTTASGRMLLDTGAVGAVTIYAQFLKLHPALLPSRSRALTAGAILPGQFVTRVGRLSEVTAGALSLHRPLTNFSANAEADDAAPGDAGLIGGQVLSRYTVTLDYAHRRAVLAPGPRVKAAYEFDASGLSLVQQGGASSSKKVRLVLPDSPAADAGIQAGDILLEIDGRPASDLSLARLRERFRVIGASYELRLQRGDSIIVRRIVTRRLI